tara:strand:+ start:46 stop:666 length:621 start_codon:yes stop_codon:yes gene_type:complete
MKIYKTLPSKKVIYKYWNESPLINSLNIQAFDGEDNRCMACGVKGSIDRAHIVSKFNGGSFQPSNVHCLCQICHKLSEHLEGHDYWLWVAIKSKLYSYGTDMTIEMDWTSSGDKTLKPYAYETEYPNKLLKYSKEYTELSLLEGWSNRKELSLLYLMDDFKNNLGTSFDINYPSLQDIEEVLEIQEEGIHITSVVLMGESKRRMEV